MILGLDWLHVVLFVLVVILYADNRLMKSAIDDHVLELERVADDLEDELDGETESTTITYDVGGEA